LAFSGLLAGVIVLPALMFSIVAWEDRVTVLEQATQDIRNTTRVLAENAHDVFATHSLVARLVDERIHGMSWDEIAQSEAVHQYLVSVVHEFPKMQSLWLVDPSGELRASSAVSSAPPISLIDRDYFVALHERDAGLFIGQMVHGRVLTEDIFNAASRRSNDSGRFDGVIVVSALPSYFANFWKEVSAADNAVELLIRRDGALLARVPQAKVSPSPLDANSPLMRAIARGDSGLFRATSPVDGRDHIIAFEKIDGFPLYVGHGLIVSGILETWHRHLFAYGIYFAITMLVLTILAVLVEMARSREAAAVHHWRQTAQQLTAEAEQRASVQAQLRQSQKMEAFGQFAGGIAHDFNNLLHVITGSMDMLKKRVAPADKPLLSLALDSANRGRKMIDSMLAFARQQPLRSEVFELNVAVGDMESLLASALGSNIKLSIVALPSPCFVRADRNQAELAILNLALNARDAMPHGGALTLTVGSEQLAGKPGGLIGGFGTVSVKDTGTGMSPDVQARVFEPFFTTKGPSKGTGLGLSMVYGFAEQTDGAVNIDSALGVGTTIMLYLPLGDPEVSAAESEPVGQIRPEPDASG
jgi:signal transduction histidine kinase